MIPIASRGVLFFLQIDFLDQRSSSAIWVRWVLWFCREGRTSSSSFSSFASCFLLLVAATTSCRDLHRQKETATVAELNRLPGERENRESFVLLVRLVRFLRV